MTAATINDLFDDSPLEDLVWNEFRAQGVAAERQEEVDIGTTTYRLDFAIYCSSGALDVETDGDLWHANPKRARVDNRRDNDLQSNGWTVLRFGTQQIREELQGYCVPKVVETINTMGGLDSDSIPRWLPVKHPDGSFQMGLFD